VIVFVRGAIARPRPRTHRSDRRGVDRRLVDLLVQAGRLDQVRVRADAVMTVTQLDLDEDGQLAELAKGWDSDVR
jgi:hypothetical protein